MVGRVLISIVGEKGCFFSFGFLNKKILKVNLLGFKIKVIGIMSFLLCIFANFFNNTVQLSYDFASLLFGIA